MKHSFFDAAFAGATVIIATGIFRFISVPVGVPIYMVSGALLLFNFVYVLKRFYAFRFNQKRILTWVFLLIFWPLMSFLYSIGGDLRAALLLLNTFLIFAGVCVLIYRRKISLLKRALSVSLVLTYIGAILNLIRPDLFNEVARLADAYVLTMGRPGGFYLQPNDLAINIVLLFAGKLALDRGDLPVQYAITAGMVVLVVLLSGSRAGLVAVGLVLMFDITGRSAKGVLQGRVSRNSLMYLMSLVLISVSVFFIASLALVLLKRTTDLVPGGLVDRLDAFLSFRLSYDGPGIQTQSISDRWEAQLHYLRLISEAPITGYGLGSEQLYFTTGVIQLSSHSSLLSMAFEYGVPYVVIFTSALISIFFLSRQSGNGVRMRKSDYWSFSVLSLVLLFYSGGLDDRVPFVILVAMAVSSMTPSSVNTTVRDRPSRHLAFVGGQTVINTDATR